MRLSCLCWITGVHCWCQYGVHGTIEEACNSPRWLPRPLHDQGTTWRTWPMVLHDFFL